MHTRVSRDILNSDNLSKAAAHSLFKEVLERYAGQDFSEVALVSVSHAISLFPNTSTFFNYRRKILLSHLTIENCAEVFQQELDWVSPLLKDSPTNTELWKHRRWVIERAVEIPGMLEQELDFLNQILEENCRFPEYWTHRYWIVFQIEDTFLNEELELTTTLLNEDFSNASAWHYRTVVMEALYPEEIPTRAFNQELLIVQNAYMSFPQLEVVWNYHRWMFRRNSPIQITGISPKEYQTPPAEFVVGFTHKVANVNDEAIAISDGWEPLHGTWRPYGRGTFGYIWVFTPNRPPSNTVEIRLNPINKSMKDVNNFRLLTSMTYKYKKTGTTWRYVVENKDNTRLIEGELEKLREMEEIEEIPAALLRKSELLSQLAASDPDKVVTEEIIDTLKTLLKLDRPHRNYYFECLEVFQALKTQRRPITTIKNQRLLALLLQL